MSERINHTADNNVQIITHLGEQGLQHVLHMGNETMSTTTTAIVEVTPASTGRIDDGGRAEAMAYSLDRTYDFAAEHERRAASPNVSASSRKNHMQTVEGQRTNAEKFAENAGKRYDEGQQRKARQEATSDATVNIEKSLEGKTLSEKLDVIKKGLAAAEPAEREETLNEQEKQGHLVKKGAMRTAFSNLVKANPQIAPGLYISVLTEYVGQAMTEGKSLEELDENLFPIFDLNNSTHFMLDELTSVINQSENVGSAFMDRARYSVLASFDSQKQSTQPRVGDNGYIDLEEARINLQRIMMYRDTRDHDESQ